jgi:hypothetical protein
MRAAFHAPNPSLLGCLCEACLEVHKRLSGREIVKNEIVPFAQRASLQNSPCCRIQRDAANLFRFGRKNVQNVVFEVHVGPLAKRAVGVVLVSNESWGMLGPGLVVRDSY